LERLRERNPLKSKEAIIEASVEPVIEASIEPIIEAAIAPATGAAQQRPDDVEPRRREAKLRAAIEKKLRSASIIFFNPEPCCTSMTKNIAAARELAIY
jgi:hypothetical protein